MRDLLKRILYKIVPDPRPSPLKDAPKYAPLWEPGNPEYHLNLKAYLVAVMEIGQKELIGQRSNPRILEYLDTTKVPETMLLDETPWCSAFVNWCIVQAGGKGTGSASARSWLSWGAVVEHPKRGDLAIFSSSRGPQSGHVGFFHSFDHSCQGIRLLGGNQGNEVRLSVYPINRLLGYRRGK